MNKIPNPFSLYDFLGYFFPGAIVVYATGLLIGHIHPLLSAQGVYERFLSLRDPSQILPFVILSYVSGHLFSYLSSITVEKYSELQYGKPSRYLLDLRPEPYFFTQLCRGQFDLLRVALGVVMLPIALFDLVLGRWLGCARFYTRGLDKLLSQVIIGKAYKRLVSIAGFSPKEEKHGGPDEAEFFLLLQHYVLENCENHRPKMDNYVALYGFLRTIAFIFLVLTWVVTYHVYVIGNAPLLPHGTPLLFAFMSFLFFMAYMKFWRRYSLEVLMAVAVSEKK